MVARPGEYAEVLQCTIAGCEYRQDIAHIQRYRQWIDIGRETTWGCDLEIVRPSRQRHIRRNQAIYDVSQDRSPILEPDISQCGARCKWRQMTNPYFDSPRNRGWVIQESRQVERLMYPISDGNCRVVQIRGLHDLSRDGDCGTTSRIYLNEVRARWHIDVGC